MPGLFTLTAAVPHSSTFRLSRTEYVHSVGFGGGRDLIFGNFQLQPHEEATFI